MSEPKVRISPVGRLVYPNLNQPRQFQGKGKFSYDTALDIEGAEGQEFARLIEECAADYAKRKGKRSINLDSVIRVALDKEKKEIDDTIRFSFKIAVIETKRGTWDRKPAFYEADGTSIDPEPNIGAGTIAQIAFTIYEWQAGPNAGITLQPEGLLIHELVERTSQSVDRSWENLFGDRVKSTRKANQVDRGGSAKSADF